jgi:phage tail-like protein
MPDHPVAFPISLTLSGGDASSPDGRCNDVSGLTPSLDVLALWETGENRFDRQLPRQVQVKPVTLRHGLVPAKGRIYRWCIDAMHSGSEPPIGPIDLTITLLDEEHELVAAWLLEDAWPVRWTASGRASTGDELVIDTLEFAFTVIRRVS